MVRDAEKYKAEDQSYAAKIRAKNTLESAAYNMKNSMADDKIKAKLAPEDVSTLSRAVGEVMDWIKEHGGESSSTTREEYEARLQELEKLCGPVWARFQKAEKDVRASADADIEV